MAISLMSFASGCGLAYQAAAEHRATKMEQQLSAGLTEAQVHEMFGEPDIEDKSDDDTTEVWSYAKRANRNDVTAELLYTSAKEGDAGTFEDLKFLDGKLVSWGEAEHTMAAKEGSGITTNFRYGRGFGGRRHGGVGQNGPNSSTDTSTGTDTRNPENPDSTAQPNPYSTTF